MPQSYSNEKSIYSVDMMFAFLKNNKYPKTDININDYLDLLDHPSWGDPNMNISYSPIDVINNPLKYQDDFKRIWRADLSYPIIISISDNTIVDGVHRFTKAYLEKRDKMEAYMFNGELMNKFKIADIKEGIWEQIDNMPMYEIISLYNERFCNK